MLLVLVVAVLDSNLCWEIHGDELKVLPTQCCFAQLPIVDCEDYVDDPVTTRYLGRERESW